MDNIEVMVCLKDRVIILDSVIRKIREQEKLKIKDLVMLEKVRDKLDEIADNLEDEYLQDKERDRLSISNKEK